MTKHIWIVKIKKKFFLSIKLCIIKIIIKIFVVITVLTLSTNVYIWFYAFVSVYNYTTIRHKVGVGAIICRTSIRLKKLL